MKCLLYSLCAFLLLINSSLLLTAQETKARLATVAFYNVENLFDTVNSVDLEQSNRIAIPLSEVSSTKTPYFNTRDEDFTPKGSYQWNHEKYIAKINKIASVINKIGRKETHQAPAIIGLAEIENEHILKDLINTKQLKKHNYQAVHFNSPDRRGIDVALLFQKKRFILLNAKPIELLISNKKGKRIYTRDQLFVRGLLDNELFCFFINHWPSRRGGEKASQPLRIAAAERCRYIIDSVKKVEPNAKIIVMGDFNDDPTNLSIIQYLSAKKYSTIKKSISSVQNLYNPYADLFRKGMGTLAYRDRWNLFDQIILSQNIMASNYKTYEIWKAKIYNPNFLLNKEGNFKNYPWRTLVGPNYQGGYSDHLPVYLLLMKKITTTK